MSQQFELPNSSKLLRNFSHNKTPYLSQTRKLPEISTHYGSTTRIPEQSESALSIQENSHAPPELDYQVQKKIQSEIRFLEERSNQQALKLKYATNLNKQQRIEAQEQADQSLINTILAKFTLTDAIGANKVFTKPQNLEHCLSKTEIQTDHFGNQFIYDMDKVSNQRGKTVWKIKKRGLDGEWINDTPFNSQNLTSNYSKKSKDKNVVSNFTSPKSSHFNRVLINKKDELVSDKEEENLDYGGFDDFAQENELKSHKSNDTWGNLEQEQKPIGELDNYKENSKENEIEKIEDPFEKEAIDDDF